MTAGYVHEKDLEVNDLAVTRETYYHRAKKREEEQGNEQLSFEEKELLTAEVAAANAESIEAAIYTLIRKHLAEYEELLRAERKARGIDRKIISGWKHYLDTEREKTVEQAQ